MQPDVAGDPTARTWVEIDLARLGGNLRALERRLPVDADVLMVVKADAYGHGLVPVARAAAAAGVWGLAVATLDEAATLRAARIRRPIVCLMPILPREAARAAALDVVPAVTSVEQAAALDAVGRDRGRPVPVHLDVDSGMGRTGVWDRAAVALAERIARLPGLELDGMFTHFASADEPDRAPTERQLDRFDDVVAELDRRGVRPPRIHAANSAAALRFGRAARALVRPGIALYGAPGEIAPDADGSAWPEAGPPFRPLLAWRARVVAVKDLAPGDSVSYHRRYVARGPERIAVLAVGYGDGWPLGLSNAGRVLLRGTTVPIRGAVCMDLTMVDATPFPDLAPGEVATLIGSADGAARRLEDVAREAGLTSYAVLTGITSRVPRRYLDASEEAE